MVHGSDVGAGAVQFTAIFPSRPRDRDASLQRLLESPAPGKSHKKEEEEYFRPPAGNGA